MLRVLPAVTAVKTRRERLLDAADLVVARDGPAASMAAIAAGAGITKPILYRVFGDKGGLYRALAERHTDTLLRALRAALTRPGDDLRARATHTVDTYLALVSAQPATYRFLMAGEAAAEPRVRGQVASFQRRFGDLLAAGLTIELGLAPGDPLAPVWAHAIVGMVQSAGDWWLGQPDPLPRAELTAGLVELLLAGLPAR